MPALKFFHDGTWYVLGPGSTPSIPNLSSFAGYAQFNIYNAASGGTITRRDIQSLWHAVPQNPIGLGGHYPSSGLDGVIYHFDATWKVSANYSFEILVGNGSASDKTLKFYTGYIQDSSGTIETLGDNSYSPTLAATTGDYIQFSGAGTLLDYTNPARPKFIAGDTYNMVFVFYFHF